jgi:hypothetical protein
MEEQMTDGPQVSIAALADRAGLSEDSVKLGALQQVGYTLARIVLAIIATTMVVIFLVAFAAFPVGPAPKPPDAMSTDSINFYKAAIDAYKTAGDAQIARATGLFTAIVGTALLPAFTGILGYIFGKSQPDTKGG